MSSHHRVNEEWMGERITTLADLLCPDLLAVVVGFNPTPVSVEAGHYYQGRAGQDFLRRLRQVGLLPERVDGPEDDVLFERGVGFTDIVKRPSRSANDIPPKEYDYGRPLLTEKIERYQPRLVIFSFEMAAPKYLGRSVGCGLLADIAIGSSDVFVTPWFRLGKERAETALGELREWLAAQKGS